MISSDHKQILTVISERYGYDFNNYSEGHIKRRLNSWLEDQHFDDLNQLLRNLVTNKKLAGSLIKKFSINVTEMFRDPEFYIALRNKVIPVLKTYPFIRVWHAGCATGEEVYSLAILLEEEGIYNNARIYATDFNESSLKTAKEGIYSNELIKKYTINYNKTRPKRQFSDYYHSNYGSVIIKQELKKNIVWANHNLVTDWAFTEAHLIICRNVMIYFNKSLQDKLLNLFLNSLVRNGFIGLGSKETLFFLEQNHQFEVIDKDNKIYRLK